MPNDNPNNIARGEDGPAASGSSGQRVATRLQLGFLGGGLVLVAVLLVYLLLLLWSVGFPAPPAPAEAITRCIFKTSLCFSMTLDVKLLLIVMVMGGLGSFVHSATSFGDFVGNERLTTNWIWWYVLRPFLGMALAEIFYLAIRGGFLSVGSSGENINLYGIAAISGLVGMFSKQATDKLSEVFNTLFKTGPQTGDATRKGDLTNPIPILSSVTPAQFPCNEKTAKIHLIGTGFVRGSLVQVNGIGRSTIFSSDTALETSLVPEDLTNPGSLDITVFNPAPGGGVSTPQLVVVSAVATGSTATRASSTPNASDAFTSGDEANIDGCDCEITDATPDEELPEAAGGVELCLSH